MKQIFGCDLDPAAFGFLQTELGEPVDTDRFHLGDFLTFSTPNHWPKSFDVVIGNPPYLPYRKIDTVGRKVARKALSKFGFEADLRSSLWVYFVALSCRDLKPGGRMAFVLPGSFLHANYAGDLRTFIASQFERTHAFELKERLFLGDGTEERSILLCAEGKRTNPRPSNETQSDIELTVCDTLSEIAEVLHKWRVGLLTTNVKCGSSVRDGLTARASKMFNEIQDCGFTSSLGEVLDVRIGLVTGNNKFFVLSDADRKRLDLSARNLSRVLSKFRYAPGLTFSRGEHSKRLKVGVRGYLVNCAVPDKAPSALQAYLDGYGDDARDACKTFKKRRNWAQPDDGNPPDAFFPVMHHGGPRLVLNPQNIQCTNTVHRAYFKPRVSDTKRRLIALSLLSTFSQLSAEIEGRSYGAGVLKHEPREAERIAIVLPNLHGNRVNCLFSQADALLRENRPKDARNLVDHALFDAVGRTAPRADIDILNVALEKVRTERHRT